MKLRILLFVVIANLGACSGSTTLVGRRSPSPGTVNTTSNPPPPPAPILVSDPLDVGVTPPNKTEDQGFKITDQPDAAVVCFDQKIGPVFAVAHEGGSAPVVFHWFAHKDGEADVEVGIGPTLPWNCPRPSLRFYVEARDASGRVITSQEVLMDVRPKTEGNCPNVQTCF
jgi:hypothetical protein